MKRSVVVAILISLVVLATMFLAYQSFKKVVLKPFPLYADISEPNNYPFIAWEDITRGKLQNSLQISYQKNTIGSFPSTAKPMTLFAPVNPYFLKNRNYASMELYKDDVVNERYLPSSVKPYKFVAFFKTQIGKENYYVLIEQFLNSDQTVSFISLIAHESAFITDNKVNDWYLDLVDPDSKLFPAPVVQINTLEACLSIRGSGEEYCSWYMKNKKRVETVTNKWPKGNRVPDEITRYPLTTIKAILTENL